jgi:hypothetical protein
MLTVRTQVIDGTGTFTLSDSQPCRLLTLLRGRYSASPLIRTHPPPSRRRSISRLSRLYDLPCSGDFSPGRGRLLQLLGMSLSPCCRFHPAEVMVPCRSDFGTPCCLRPMEAGSAFGSTPFRGHLRVHCCYGPVTRDLPKGDFVDRLQDFGFPPPCYTPASVSAGLIADPRKAWPSMPSSVAMRRRPRLLRPVTFCEPGVYRVDGISSQENKVSSTAYLHLVLSRSTIVI